MDDFDDFADQIDGDLTEALKVILDACRELENADIPAGVVSGALMIAARVGVTSCFESRDVEAKMHELVGISGTIGIGAGEDDVVH